MKVLRIAIERISVMRCALVLGLSLSVGGCRVLERAELCGQLARLVASKGDALSPRLPANPSPQALEHKAQLYRELAQSLKSVEVPDDRVNEGRDLVVQQLEKVAQELENATEAVVLHQKEQADEKQEGKKQPAPRPEPATNEAAPSASSKAEQRRQQSAAPAERSKDAGAVPPAGEVLPVDEAEKNRLERKKRPTQRSKQSSTSKGRRDYQRARKAAESSGRALKMALDDLSKTCR